MLTLTENATATVKTIAEQSETAGLRITADGEESFAISTAEQAETDDQLVAQDGAQVYLDAGAAEQLADKVLDAAVDDEGNVQFGLGQQEEQG